jgi:hypothetical protein
MVSGPERMQSNQAGVCACQKLVKKHVPCLCTQHSTTMVIAARSIQINRGIGTGGSMQV